MGFQMKRYNNLFEQIVSLDNLYLAEKKARKNKTHRPEVIEFDKNKEQLLLELQKMLIEGTYEDIKSYLENQLNLRFKDNWQIFKVDSRGIDFVGYRLFHTHILLRKRIKQNFCRKITKLNKKDIDKDDYKQKICSYIGWIKHCNGRNLFSKMLKYKELLEYVNIHRPSKT